MKISSNHELIIRVNQNKLYVSCKCRATTGKHSKAGKIYYEYIGQTKDHSETVELFNDPENHWEEFTKEDELVKPH